MGLLQLLVTIILPVILPFIVIPWLFLRLKKLLQTRGIIKAPALRPENAHWRGFLYSFLASLPGVLIYAYLVWLSWRGASGTEFGALLFFPLFVVSVFCVPLTIIFGSLYVLKEESIAGRVAGSVIVIGYSVLTALLLADSLAH